MPAACSEKATLPPHLLARVTSLAYDMLFEAIVANDAIESIYRKALVDEYAEDAKPYGFVTASEIRRIVSELRLQTGQTFGDLGCGCGGVGLWIARTTGASVFGIDISQVAVRCARQRAEEHGFGRERAQFAVGDLAETGIPDESLDGAICVDALLFVPDKLAALRETARILRPGAHFVFTTWDASDLYETSDDFVPCRLIRDHRPALEAASFAIEAYEEVPGWQRRQLDFYALIREARERLVPTLGIVATTMLLKEASTVSSRIGSRRRVLVVARRR